MKPIYNFLDLKVCIDNCKKKDEKEEFELILFKYSFAQIFLSKILES